MSGDSTTTRPVFVHTPPDRSSFERITSGNSVVIDVLRASSTIVSALDSDAESVFPVQFVDEAFATRHRLSSGGTTPLLGGERAGLLIDGFDLDNSPAAYTPEVVSGQRIVFTTTNGTRALLASVNADRIAIGCLNNLSAVTRWLCEVDGPVHLVCAGTNDEQSDEDLYAAVQICEALADSGVSPLLNVDEELNRHLGSISSLEPEAALRGSLGGRNVLAIGREADLLWCAEVDRSDIVPVFNAERGCLVACRS